MTTESNPYAPPRARVQDTSAHAEEYCELTPWTVQGRIGRLRFVAWIFVLMLAVAVPVAIITAIFGEDSALGDVLVLILGLGTFYFGMCMQGKRLHDMNYSAWFLLILFIPIIGTILSIVTLFWPGNEGENDYGPPAPPNSSWVKFLSGLFIAAIVISILGIIAALVLGKPV